ncbi:MAG: homocysteine methyltransferase [Ruminococcaceae bacterium]|nr:homocysteine methyltransferase [Oscillospiraceae bacterium]
MNNFPFSLPLILDGSTGAMLSAAGMPEGVCPELWTMEHPEVITEIQQGYVRAGSRAVYSPTFCANRVKLAKYGLAARVEEMNRELVRISRAAVGEEILIGGDMTSLGLFLKPFGEATFEEFVEVYREQAAALDAAGVDFFIPETLMSLAEARAAVTAIRSVSDKPIFVTVTCDAAGRMLSGTSAAAALVVLQEMGIQAFGLNCSVGPEAMAEVIATLRPYAKIPLIVKPNAGLPVVEDGKTVFKLTPADFAAHTAAFAARGVQIFGGCCGTNFHHIEALTASLDGIPLTSPQAEGLFCASEREVFALDPMPDFGERIEAGEYLADDLMDAEDAEAEAVWIHVADEDGLAAFEENQYLVKTPLRLSADTQELLRAAVRVYQGAPVCAAEDWFDGLAGSGAVKI